jgi:hypothetical protein
MEVFRGFSSVPQLKCREWKQIRQRPFFSIPFQIPKAVINITFNVISVSYEPLAPVLINHKIHTVLPIYTCNHTGTPVDKASYNNPWIRLHNSITTIGTGITYLRCNLLTYGAEPVLRSCKLCSHSETSQQFTEPVGSLQCSQEPSTGRYPKPDRCSPYQPILSL